MRPLNSGSPLTIAAGTSVSVSDLQRQDKWAVLYNLSYVACSVTTPVGMRTLAPWTADLFQVGGNGSQPGLTIAAQSFAMAASPRAATIIGDVFYDTEKPAGSFPLSLAYLTQLADQPRVVSVPVGITQFAAGNFNPGVSNPFDVINLSWNAAILAAKSAVLYFYGVKFDPSPGQTGSMGIAVQAQPVDAGGGNIGGPVNLFWGSVYCNDTNKTGTGCGWQSPFPLCFVWQPQSWPANMDHLHILLSKQGGDNIAVNYTLACNTDRSNFAPVGEIGNGSLFAGLEGSQVPLF